MSASDPKQSLPLLETTIRTLHATNSSMNDSSPSDPAVAMSVANAVESNSRNGVMRLYAALFGLLLLLFAALISGDCYFNYWSFRISIGFLAVSVLACGIKWFLIIRHNGYQVSDRMGGHRRLGLIEIPFFAGMLGWVFGGWLWAVFFAVINLAIFFGPQRTEQTTAQLEVRHWDTGRCRVGYSFFEPAIQRQISNCGLPYAGAARGDQVTVRKLVGPLGIRLLSVRLSSR